MKTDLVLLAQEDFQQNCVRITAEVIKLTLGLSVLLSGTGGKSMAQFNMGIAGISPSDILDCGSHFSSGRSLSPIMKLGLIWNRAKYIEFRQKPKLPKVLCSKIKRNQRNHDNMVHSCQPFQAGGLEDSGKSVGCGSGCLGLISAYGMRLRSPCY